MDGSDRPDLGKIRKSRSELALSGRRSRFWASDEDRQQSQKDGERPMAVVVEGLVG